MFETLYEAALVEAKLSGHSSAAFQVHLAVPIPSSGTRQTLKDALEGPERQIILQCLRENNWNRNETAEELGINRTALYKKMKKLGLENPRDVLAEW